MNFHYIISGWFIDQNIILTVFIHNLNTICLHKFWPTDAIFEFLYILLKDAYIIVFKKKYL